MSDVRVRKISDFATKVGSGSTPKGGEANYKSEGVPLIRSMNVHFDGFRYDGLAFLDDDQASALKNVEVCAGDVLLNITGASIGRVTVAPEKLQGARVNQHVCIIRPDESVSSSYLRWYLASPVVQRQINSMESGATRQALTKEKILGFEVPVPDLMTQHQVVAEIEKQFSRLDEAVANLQRVKANLKRYKASVLKAAVEGRLVETEASIAQREGRSYETGEQLLQRILDERRAKWSGKGNYKEPLPHDVQGLPKAPEGWVWCSLDLVAAETLIGLDRGRDQQRAEPVGVRYVKMNNVSMDGDVQTDELVYVDATPEEVARYEVTNGDLLFNTRNSLELVGKVGIVRSIPAYTVFNNNLMRIRTCGGVSPVFLGYQMCAFEFRQRMEKVKKATTSVAAVYQKDLLPLAIAVPPESEQVRIVAEIDRHLSIIREVEAEVDTSLQRAQTLRQATLSSAFSCG